MEAALRDLREVTREDGFEGKEAKGGAFTAEAGEVKRQGIRCREKDEDGGLEKNEVREKKRTLRPRRRASRRTGWS